MKKWTLPFAQGKTRVGIRGTGVVRCMNLLLGQGAELKDVFRKENGIEAWISTAQLPTLERCAQKSGCYVEILKSKGVPAWKRRYANRWGFLIGGLLALGMMIFLNCYIWRIDIKGNKSISDTQVLSRLTEVDLKQGSWKTGKDLEAAKNTLLLAYPEWSWISLSIEGSTLVVRVEEATMPPEIFQEGEPADLVADREGIIHSIVARSGTPQVRAGDVVKAGDVLISGTIVIEMEDGSKQYEYTQAKGEIYAECIYTIEREQEKRYVEKRYTGETVHELVLTGEEGEMILYRPICSLENADMIEQVLGQGFTEFLAELPIIPRRSLLRRTYVFYVPEEKVYREDQLKVLLNSELQKACSALVKERQGVLLEEKTDYKDLGKVMKGVMTIHLIENMGKEAPLTSVEEENIE
ncbi:MAG: sporulation protein YqfD [Firmicutes bacterium]|nr:sporulation protein YqfD [Bacillota bacterium]